jgi:L-fuconolactonase
LLEDVIRATDLVPDLRVIIDHLPNLATPAEPARRAAYESALSELGSRPRVFVKLSAVLQDRDGEVAHSLEPYRAKLDEIFEAFGEDRVLFGSDWPNSAPLGSYGRVLSVVREYFDEKGPEAAEKYFWRNSVRAYGWTKRAANQPG